MNNLGSLLDMPELNSPKLAELWIANFGCLNVFSTSWKRQNLIRCSNIYLFIRLWLYLVILKDQAGSHFSLSLSAAVSWWADAEREDGEEVWRNGGLLHTCSHASSDMDAIWLMGSARRNTHLNPASSSCIITCFLVPIRTGWLMASHTHTHIKSSAHSCTADACLKQTELSIFSPRGLSCLCVRGEDESTMEGKVWPWRRGGAEDVEKRKGRRGVCLNLDALSCQRNTTRLKQTKKTKKIPGSCSALYSFIHTAAAASSAPAWEFWRCMSKNKPSGPPELEYEL